MAIEIDGKTMAQLLASGAVLVDVREEEEIDTDGRIRDTEHWPLSSFASRQCEISRSRPTIFYCRSGLRSLKAAEIAENWTDQEVFSLKGGFLEYSQDESNSGR